MNLFMSWDHFILFTPAVGCGDFLVSTLLWLEALSRTDGDLTGLVTRAVPLALLLGPNNGSLSSTTDWATWPVASEALVWLRVFIIMFVRAFYTNGLVFFDETYSHPLYDCSRLSGSCSPVTVYFQLLGPKSKQASVTALTGFDVEVSFSLRVTSHLHYHTSALLLHRYPLLQARDGRDLFRCRLWPGLLVGVFLLPIWFYSRSFPSPMSIHIGRRPTMSLGLTGPPCYVLKAMEWASV